MQKTLILGKTAVSKITACNFSKETPSQVSFTGKLTKRSFSFVVFPSARKLLLSTQNINFTWNQVKGMCSLKIHDSVLLSWVVSNECEHDSLYVSKIKDIILSGL